ncbi:ABC transporter substrate-binding protein [Microbacterium tumbae]
MSRSTFRSAAAVALASALALSAVACSSSTPNAGADDPLELWIFLDPSSADDPRGAALKEIVSDYNAQTDGPEVTVRSINYAKIDAEVIKATASGQGPDLLNVYSNQLPMHVAAGTVQPITEFAEPAIEALGDDFLFPVDGVTFDGEIMAMPWEIRAWLLWYREDLLNDAGLEVPTTLDEIGQTAAALQKTGVTGLGVGFSNAGLGADFVEKFIPFTWNNGGEILDGDEAVFADAAGAASMQTFIDWKDAGAFGEEVLSMGADEVVNGVKAGTIAMAIEGSYRVAAARSGDGIGDNLKTAPLPSDDPSKPMQTPIAGQTMTIGANASNPQAAWDFIEFYTSAASQEKFAAAGVLPVLSSVYESDAVQALPNADELSSWLDYVREYGRPNPVSENFSELSDSLVTGAQEIVFQDGDAATILQRVADDYNAK